MSKLGITLVFIDEQRDFLPEPPISAELQALLDKSWSYCLTEDAHPTTVDSYGVLESE